MAKLPFLDKKSVLWNDWHEAWARDARRLVGGDDILPELVRWKNEDEVSFTQRTNSARYTNFPDVHATVLSGHIKAQQPAGSWGDLGVVRPREEQNRNQKSIAEIFTYNCDGIGNDGSQYPAWLDGVRRRAIGTGFRWIMVEMPTLAALNAIRRKNNRPENGAITERDNFEGFRPYVVDVDPLAVERHRVEAGALQWASIRVPVPAGPETSESDKQQEKGFYLLVRRGYTGLGEMFAVGGWWLLNPEHDVLDKGLWDSSGEIPLFPMIAKRSTGTYSKPAIAQSLTMELGQISVDLMNARSEWRHNVRHAAKGILYLLGVDPETHQLTVEQNESGSFVVGVAPVMLADGKVGIPQLWSSSEGAVASGVFKELLQAGTDDARDVMVKQISSPAASGEKVKSTFEEGTSPLLAAIAEGSETADNTIRQFVAQRLEKTYGGVVTYPREYRIRDTVSDIDQLLDTMKKAEVTSPTLQAKLVIKQAEQLGQLDDDDDRDAIIAELEDSAKQKIEQKRLDQEAQRQMNAALADTGTNPPTDKGPPPPPPPPAA